MIIINNRMSVCSTLFSSLCNILKIQRGSDLLLRKKRKSKALLGELVFVVFPGPFFRGCHEKWLDSGTIGSRARHCGGLERSFFPQHTAALHNMQIGNMHRVHISRLALFPKWDSVLPIVSNGRRTNSLEIFKHQLHWNNSILDKNQNWNEGRKLK